MERTARSLVFYFTMMCLLTLANCSELTPDQKAALMQPLSDQELARLHNASQTTGACQDKINEVFEGFAKFLVIVEPIELPQKNRLPCEVCYAYNLSTIRIDECGVKIAVIPPVNAEYETGIYYEMDIKFPSLLLKCWDCTIRDNNGKPVKGEFESIWSNLQVELVVYKRVWNAGLAHFQSAKLTTKPKPKDVHITYSGSSETFEKLFQQGCEEGKFNFGIEDYVVSVFPTTFDKLEEKVVKHKLEYPFAETMTCNNADAGSEEIIDICPSDM